MGGGTKSEIATMCLAKTTWPDPTWPLYWPDTTLAL